MRGAVLLLGSLLASLVVYSNDTPDRLEQLSRTLSQGDYAGQVYNPIAQKYVKASKVNVRNAPVNGKIVGSLKQGQKVLIYDRSGSWERISKESESPKWVSSSLLCSSDGCYIESRISTFTSKSSTTKATSNFKSSTSSSLKKATSSSYGGSCPCSLSSNCVGPRGGTYCYTSGGNKRYR